MPYGTARRIICGVKVDPLAQRVLALLLAQPDLRGHAIQAVWLFGSRARGDAAPGSDIDLGILCEPALGMAVASDVASGLALESGIDVDLIDLAAASPLLRWLAVHEGLLLYEAPGADLWPFIRRARDDAEDRDASNRIVNATALGRDWR